MRCETCGAHNAEAAAWCTQCYAPFAASDVDADDPGGPTTQGPPDLVDPPVAPPADPPVAAQADPPVVAPPPDPGTAAASLPPPASDEPDAPASSTPVEVGDVRQVDGEVEWRCRTCGAWTALEMPICATCGAARSGFGDAPRPELDVAELDGNRILGASLVLPGLGHVLAGRTGSGITRMVLALLWLIGGLWWVLATATGRAPGAILLIGAVALWIVSAVDVRALVAGTDEPFGVRGLLWLVVGVTGLLMLTVAFLATGAAG